MTLLTEDRPAPAGAPAACAADLVKLRPIVHASPTPTGIHVRGWASSFTVDGGPGVWQLWRLLAGRLAEGVPSDQAGPPQGRVEVVRAAELILAQLREHDMLVQVPASWRDQADLHAPSPAVASWLESVATDPAAAWQRLRRSRARVAGGGLVAEVAARALRATGLAGTRAGLARSPVRGTLLHADPDTAVAADCHDEVGFVVPPGRPGQVTTVAAAVAARLRLPEVSGRPPYPLAALVAGAAAHRLVCAVAGLPDPAAEAVALHQDVAGGLLGTHPAVLVARLDPLRATYHPWLPGAAPAATDPVDLDQALSRLDALCDPELGALPAARPGDLPQVPAGLAIAGGALGVGVTTDTARVDATVRAFEHILHERLAAAGPPGAGVAVGVGGPHATGTALRRLVHARLPELLATPVPESEWAQAPAARRWWKALTLRFAVPARVRVRRLAPDAVHAAVSVGGQLLAWAVEASPADAVAFAALAATGLVQAEQAGVDVTGRRPVALTGAAPAWAPDRLDATGWAGAGWYWPVAVAGAEPRLQAALRRLVPARLTPVPPAVAPDLLSPLAASGFVALRVPDPGQGGGQP